MRKQYSLSMELAAIRTLCLEPESRASQDLLAKLDDAHFATEVGRAAFKRCNAIMRKSSTLPDWAELVSDPGIDEDIRDTLDQCELPAVVSRKRCTRLIGRLDEYKKLRMLTQIGAHLERRLLKSTDPISADDIIAEVTNKLSQARSNRSFRVMRLGANTNTDKKVARLLAGKSINYIPTGFDGFDSINRGIPQGSFMLLGGPTGAGKSLLLTQMAENAAMAGAKCGFTALEMDNDEMLQRLLARDSQVDMTKLLDPLNKLKESEREAIRENFVKLNQRMAGRSGSVDYYEFEEDVSIESLTAAVKPFDLDVLFIDYLGLLEGADSEDQWRKLGQIARYCHVWGKANKTTVIAACQVSDEGLIRYSKAMSEHAKFFWTWSTDDYFKSTGVAMMHQRKARQASDHSFMLKFDHARMSVRDATVADVKQFEDEKKSARSTRGENKQSWKEKGGLDWDAEEEDIPAPQPGRNAQAHRRTPPARGHQSRPAGNRGAGGGRGHQPREVNL